MEQADALLSESAGLPRWASTLNLSSPKRSFKTRTYCGQNSNMKFWKVDSCKRRRKDTRIQSSTEPKWSLPIFPGQVFLPSLDSRQPETQNWRQYLIFLQEWEWAPSAQRLGVNPLYLFFSPLSHASACIGLCSRSCEGCWGEKMGGGGCQSQIMREDLLLADRRNFVSPEFSPLTVLLLLEPVQS